jgi:hypothetical protein
MNQVSLRFLASHDTSQVSSYALLALNDALAAASIPQVRHSHGRTGVFLRKAFSKLRVPRNLARRGTPVFVAFMGFSESKVLPFSLWTEIIPYCFDCWPRDYQRWSSFFRRHRVRLAFFSARQSAEHFRREMPDMRSEWLPEATDPKQYECSLTLADRNIDVLELGRRSDVFHESVTNELSRACYRHLYERTKGEIVFRTREAFKDGLAHTRVSVCFPSSTTHPGRSGDVETVTHRYFESMAAKCLVLGQCPAELRDLFGYNPVIETEREHEAQQLVAILRNIEKYQPDVERNYRRLLEVATWGNRVAQVLASVRSAFPSTHCEA